LGRFSVSEGTLTEGFKCSVTRIEQAAHFLFAGAQSHSSFVRAGTAVTSDGGVCHEKNGGHDER
jgi:hypothetical protein